MLARLLVEVAGLARSTSSGTLMRYLSSIAIEMPSVLRSRTLAAADRKMAGPIVFRTWNGRATIDFGALDRELAFDQSSAFGLARELFGRNVYLRAFQPFHGNGGIALDLGGNRGLATVLMSAAFSPAKIIYIEPDKRYLPTLRMLTTPHIATEVEVHHGYVGVAPQEHLELLDLDRLLPNQLISFVKMDIEGAEQQLLAGSATWLDRTARIAMESHPDTCDVGEVVRMLEARGFFVYPSDPIGRHTAASEAGFVYAARSKDDLADKFRAHIQPAR